MKKTIFYVFVSILCFCLFSANSSSLFLASAKNNDKIVDECKASFLYEANSKTIISEHNSDQRLPIASMTKIATLAVIFDSIEKNKISVDQLVRVSQTAADVEGSQAFLDAGSEYKVSDLIMTVVVASANDSSIALAEQAFGSEQKCVLEMNKLVKELNLKNTNFENVTGLPAIDHYSSARDISVIYSLICDNPLYKKFSKIWNTELVHPSGRKTDITNTNRLIKSYEGCDSGKTGYTSQAGYCLVASATRQDMRLVGVVIGANDSKQRFNQMANMFNYGFNNYQNQVVISNDVPLVQVDILNSNKKKVDLYVENDYIKFLNKGEIFEYTLDFKINKIKAPIGEGQECGFVFIIDKNNMVVDQIPLVIKENIKAITLNEILHKIYSEII